MSNRADRTANLALLARLYGPGGAAIYDHERRHGLTIDGEAAHWQRLFVTSVAVTPPVDVLDLGCGTGTVSGLLADAGYRVTGIDASESMLAKARLHVPNAHFVQGDIQRDRSTFGAASFDALVTRQVVGHLEDPLDAFSIWHSWLKPGGRLVVCDGFFELSGWSVEGDHRSAGYQAWVAEHLPLACQRTPASLRYLLECASFKIVHSLDLSAIDRLHGDPHPSRYGLVAVAR